MKKFFLLTLTAAALFSSCKKEHDMDRPGIFKGPEEQVHDGKAWTWFETDKAGQPKKLALAITDAALNSVPVGDGGTGPHDHGDMENNWILKFHPKADVLPFNHVGMGWNPNGHEPEQVYGLPHFDFHFYMPTPEEIAAIPVYEQAKEKFDNYPAAEYFPANYMNFGGGVPQMGAHWIDVTSPEINGAKFTQTFIYGSYDGKVTFYEPMITLEFLKATSNFTRPIPEPAKVQKTGWYPTELNIVKHDGLTEIILNKMVYKTQS